MKIIRTLLFTTLCGLCSLQASAVTIIANPSTGGDIDAHQVKRIFLGKQTTLADGSRAIPVNQTQTAPIRIKFDTNVLGRSSSQVTAYWSKLVFTGKGNPPKEMANDDAVLSYVRNTPGAIGYVSDDAHPEGLRVISLLD